MEPRDLLLLATVVLCLATGATANVIPQSEDLYADNPGLYNASDSVITLTEVSFKPSVLYSKRAWLVEFYNSWCGFCQRFAPMWKAVAKSAHGWRDIVAIAAIDCANDHNNPTCREYEIMRYPTLKFFKIDTKDNASDYGVELKKSADEGQIIQALIEQLVKEEQEQRAGPTWPNLVPFRGNDLETLWHGAPSKVQNQFLIFEEPKSSLAEQVILDLHTLDTIRIRKVSSENEFLSVTSKVTKFPSVIALGRDNSQTLLKIDTITRDGIRETIVNYLKSKGVSVDIKEDNDIHFRQLNSAKSESRNKNKRESVHTEDKLYQLDLDTTLHYSFNREIPLSPRIFGEKLKALKDYLNVLSLYFPAHLPKMKTYLQVLHKIVDGKSNMTGREFREQVKTNEKGLTPVYSGPETFIGCKGSTPTLRGYPCGLWTLFHTLTVAAAEEIGNAVHDDDHPSVLVAMHGYIKNFFSCADCSDHFQQMSVKRNLFDIHRGDDSILWLWRAHNEVNERLSGDETEDPEHKKIQYPAAKHCPKCKLPDGKWDETEVLKYLKTKYGSHTDLEGISDQFVQHEINMSASSSGVSAHKIGWDFTIFDISICVVLYALSSTILILVCIKFAVKRTSRKKISFYNMFRSA